MSWLEHSTDISSEHCLRTGTCTQVRRNVRKFDVVYAWNTKENNATEVTGRAWHLTLRSGAFIAQGSTMCSPFVLTKGIISQVRRSYFYFYSFIFF